MRKIALIVALFAFVGISNAQHKKDKSGKRGLNTEQSVKKTNNLDRMQTELGLSEAQRAEIIAISDRYMEKKVAIRSTATLEQLHEIENQRKEEIKALLNSEQLKKYEVWTEKRGAGRLSKEVKISK